jgi:[ribosomal protein S5]-alanine N-acetyltransferase
MGLPETIRTDRLELRPFLLSDGPAVFAYSQDPDWAEYQQSTPSSEREADRIVAELSLRDWENQPAWAITRSGEVVGLVSLVFDAGHRIALLGYGIHEKHRGLGLTGEAVRAVLDQAFTVHGQLTRVAANTDARNHSSSRLLEKLGFSREGTLRSGGVTAKGELVDGAIYGLLRSEWQLGAG